MGQDTQDLRIEQAGIAEPSPHRHEADPELVRKVADKVYAMLLHDLRIERERQRRRQMGMGHTGGSKL